MMPARSSVMTERVPFVTKCYLKGNILMWFQYFILHKINCLNEASAQVQLLNRLSQVIFRNQWPNLDLFPLSNMFKEFNGNHKEHAAISLHFSLIISNQLVIRSVMDCLFLFPTYICIILFPLTLLWFCTCQSYETFGYQSK